MLMFIIRVNDRCTWIYLLYCYISYLNEWYNFHHLQFHFSIGLSILSKQLTASSLNWTAVKPNAINNKASVNIDDL